MNAAELLQIIQRPNELSKEDFRALIKLHETFPYFLVPKVLAAKYEQKIAGSSSKELLHWAAVESPDRSWLKQLIEEEVVLPGESSKNIAPAKDPEAIIQQEKENPPAINSRAEVLKKLEENLNKLRKPEAENPGKTPEVKAVDAAEAAVPAAEEIEAVEPAKKKKAGIKRKGGDDLIETIRQKEKKEIKDAKKQEQMDIIKAFSSKDIKLAAIKENEDSKKLADLSESSTVLSDKLISESYAKLLLKQGKKEKAKGIYRKLSLKFPKKKAYFAELLKELEG